MLPSKPISEQLSDDSYYSDSQFCTVCLCLEQAELHMAEISCLLGRLWRNLSSVEKLPFMKGCFDVDGVLRCSSYVENNIFNVP